MQTIIADTFQTSLDALDSVHHGSVKVAAYDLQADPSHPSFQFHRVERSKEKNFWTARVNVDIRMVVYKDKDHLVLCYVDHHDDAYRWAESRRFALNRATGAVQVVLTREVVSEVVRPVYSFEQAQAPAPKLFAHFDDDYLMALGVPESYLEAVNEADQTVFWDQLMGILPEEASENLVRLATGEVLPRPVPPVVEDPFLHPDAQRRFRVVDKDAKALERALNVPWEKWAVFLHPNQREVVERDYSGPARVTGGAGTGKTVVALHRAAHLARTNPKARILLTTYSRTLATRLQHALGTLLGPDAPEGKRIRVANLHTVAAELWRKAHAGPLELFDAQADLGPLMMAALRKTGASEHPPEFYEVEWSAVVDPEGVRTWDAYRRVSRAGRGTPLGARQRQGVWRVFETLHQDLEARGQRTWQRVCYEVAEGLGEPPFDFVVADEVQDFGPAELRLLRALAPEGRNDVFLTGDLGQRIYKGATSFLGAGIDIRGRSTVLRLNYRTTEQIRRFADTLLPGTLRDADGEEETRTNVSLITGPEPTFVLEPTVMREREAVARWLKAQVSTGFYPHEIAIFARTSRLLDERVKHVVRHCGLTYHELDDQEPPQERRVAIGTMHRAKGLEFKVVIVMGCDAGELPLRSVLQRLPDEAARATFREQERNLFYVACTRARERLLVSAAGAPSTLMRR